MVKKQLSYVRRELGYLEKSMEEGYAPVKKGDSVFAYDYETVEQQLYMYENKTHTVEHRIVSISQPWLRPIVRGKAKALDSLCPIESLRRLPRRDFGEVGNSGLISRR